MWDVRACAFKKSAAVIKCVRIKLTCNNKIFNHLTIVIWVPFQIF